MFRIIMYEKTLFVDSWISFVFSIVDGSMVLHEIQHSHKNLSPIYDISDGIVAYCWLSVTSLVSWFNLIQANYSCVKYFWFHKEHD